MSVDMDVWYVLLGMGIAAGVIGLFYVCEKIAKWFADDGYPDEYDREL